MVGIAKKNENSAAALRDKPKNKPPIMVAPERDVPGIKAQHCAKPSLRHPKASYHLLQVRNLMLTFFGI
jgi:hypothetical protein